MIEQKWYWFLKDITNHNILQKCGFRIFDKMGIRWAIRKIDNNMWLYISLSERSCGVLGRIELDGEHFKFTNIEDYIEDLIKLGIVRKENE